MPELSQQRSAAHFSPLRQTWRQTTDVRRRRMDEVLAASATPAAGIVIAGLLTALFGPAFVSLAKRWSVDPNYSHGFLVPCVALLLAGRAWWQSGPPYRRLIATSSARAGVAGLVLGILLHFVAWFTDWLLLDVVAVMWVLRSLLQLAGGREAVRNYGAAVLFLIFMAPLPMAWQQTLPLALQTIVSAVSVGVLYICGIPVFREGYFVHLPGYTMEVGEACSGVRQATAFLALAVLVLSVSRRSRSYKLAVLAASLPVAVVANSARIVLTGIILIVAGPSWATGAFHTLEGLGVLVLGLGLLAGAAWLLGRADEWVRHAWPTRKDRLSLEVLGDHRRPLPGVLAPEMLSQDESTVAPGDQPGYDVSWQTERIAPAELQPCG